VVAREERVAGPDVGEEVVVEILPGPYVLQAVVEIVTEKCRGCLVKNLHSFFADALNHSLGVFFYFIGCHLPLLEVNPHGFLKCNIHVSHPVYFLSPHLFLIICQEPDGLLGSIIVGSAVLFQQFLIILVGRFNRD